MQALKALVGIMGVMIIAGVTILGIGIYRRATAPHPAEGIATTPSAPLHLFGSNQVTLPKGSRFETAMTDQGRLVLQIRLQDGTRQFTVVDLSNGSVLGTVNVPPGEPAVP